MSMKGKGGKGGKAKGGGKSHSAGESIAITKTKARATASINDTILTLREALFDAKGRNRDVTASIAPAFMKYDRKGLDCSIEFAPKLSKEECKRAHLTGTRRAIKTDRPCILHTFTTPETF
jgi:hypothetical protein